MQVPTTATKNAQIQDWLTSKDIEWAAGMLKAELLQIVKEHKHHNSDYVIDRLMRSTGHKIPRLPPYHCELNLTELIWAQVKKLCRYRNNRY